MFGRGKKANGQLHLYGKLPCAKDYLRHGMSEGAAGALRSWLDRGFDQVAPGGGAFVPKPQNFVFSDGGSTVVVGSLWPSHDQGGHRQFPFCLATDLKVKEVLQALATDWAPFDGVWRQLQSVRRELTAASNGPEVLALARSRSLDHASASSGRAVDRASPSSARDWFDRLFGPQSTERLLDLRNTLKSAAGSRTVARLPLLAGARGITQAAAWWRLASLCGWPNLDSAGSLWYTDPIAVGGSMASIVMCPSGPTPSLVASLCGDEGFGVATRNWAIDAQQTIDGVVVDRLADSVESMWSESR